MPWDSLHSSSQFWEFGLAVLIFLILVVATLRSSRQAEQRRRVMGCLSSFGVSLLCLLAASLFGAAGWGRTDRWLWGIGILLTGISFIQLAGLFLFQVLLSRLGLAPPRILQDVVVLLASIVWGLIQLHGAGVDLAGIITTSAVLTAVIGLSLQDTLGNILSGLALQLDQSVQVGDWIQIEDHPCGRVAEIRWRYTSIETRDWETIVIPNSVLTKHMVKVLGRRAGAPIQQRQWIPFNIDYKQSPAEVIESVNKDIRLADISGVARAPEPTCLLVDIAGPTARYAVAYWLTNLSAKNPTDSEMRVHIYSALKRAGIPIAIPAQNLFLFEETSEKRAVEIERELQQRMKALRTIDLFSHFDPGDLRVLAERLRPAPFARGDILTRQGARADWLYIIINGKADVFVENETHGRAKVAEIGPGSLLGEMGLMTGEPRAATVVAKTNMETYRLDKESFRNLIISRPEAADQISALLAKRRAELDALKENLDAEAQAVLTDYARHDIRSKILHFFGLEA